MTLTLAKLHHQNKNELPSYSRIIAMAKRGELSGIGEYEVGLGWPVLDEQSFLSSISQCKSDSFESEMTEHAFKIPKPQNHEGV